jgi:anti-sigma factor RsiW
MTSPAPTWHVPDRELDRYVAGTIAPVSAASIESHVITCAACRTRVAEQARTDTLVDTTWAAIADAIDRPSSNRLRMLGRLERGRPMMVVTFGSPALRWSGALALGVVVLLPLALNGLGLTGAALTLFLVLAPLLPLAGIAASYSAAIDPAGELAMATPARTIRLLLWRGLTVLAVSVPLVVLAAIPFSAPAGLTLVWILPALALCAITIAAATWRDPVPVAIGLAASWAVTALLLTIGGGRSAAAVTNAITSRSSTIQIVSLVAIVVGVAVAALRREAFEQAGLS